MAEELPKVDFNSCITILANSILIDSVLLAKIS